MDSLQEYLSKKFKRIQRRSYEGGNTDDNGSSNQSYNPERIKRRDNYTCGYCGSERSPNKLKVNQIVDERLATKYNLTDLIQKLDNPGNIVSVCLPCNREKDRKGVEEFFYQHPERFGNLFMQGKYVCDRILESLISVMHSYSEEKKVEEIKKTKELFDVSEET